MVQRANVWDFDHQVLKSHEKFRRRASGLGAIASGFKISQPKLWSLVSQRLVVSCKHILISYLTEYSRFVTISYSSQNPKLSCSAGEQQQLIEYTPFTSHSQVIHKLFTDHSHVKRLQPIARRVSKIYHVSAYWVIFSIFWNITIATTIKEKIYNHQKFRNYF